MICREESEKLRQKEYVYQRLEKEFKSKVIEPSIEYELKTLQSIKDSRAWISMKEILSHKNWYEWNKEKIMRNLSEKWNLGMSSFDYDTSKYSNRFQELEKKRIKDLKK